MSEVTAGWESSAQDRAISSLAIVKVNFDRGHSFLDNFAPFLRHCMAESEVEAIAAPELQEDIEKEFGLSLPLAVIRTLLKREERAGRVKRIDKTLWVEREALVDASLEAERVDAERKQNALIESIVSYANANFAETVLDSPWDPDRAQRRLLEYLDTFSTKLLAATVAGRSLVDTKHKWTGDQYIVHKFVLHAAASDPSSFAFLEVVVKGKMLADAVYVADSEERDQPRPLTKLEVYFDGPILLHLLGYAGPELAAPYVELVEMLIKQGANPRCFTESIEEARGILDVASERAWTGQTRKRFYGDVVTYLVQQGKSKADIMILAASLEDDLLRLGIQSVDQPPPIQRLTTDEIRFEEILKAEIHYTNPIAMTTDLEALTAIHRLREGRAARSLRKSKAVFVTRNLDLVRASARFFEQRRLGVEVPNCVHDAPFTTMVWLNQPLGAPNLPKERIIADAYAAMNPSDRLWRAFMEEIEELQSSDRISVEDADILRLAGESKQALMDETLGDDDLYLGGTAKQVLEKARESLRAEMTEALSAERAAREAAEERLGDRRVAIEARARWMSQWAIRLLLAVGVPLLAAGFLLGPLGPLDDGWSPLPGVVQAICTLAAIAISAWSLWAGVSLRGLAQEMAKLLERRLVRLLERLTAADDGST